MEVFVGVGIALGGIVMIILLRSLTTLFHELGHAIPALVFTSKVVEVYVGSYGSIEESLHFRLGRLRFYLRWNPFVWQLGMCRQGERVAVWKELLIILGGPLASTLLAILAFFMIINYELSDGWFYLAALFAGAALIDLFTNLYTHDRELLMHDGQVVYSDGYQIRNLLRELNLPEGYFEAARALGEGKVAACKAGCESLLEDGLHKKKVYELYWQALAQEENYQAILDLYREYKEHHKLLPKDYYQIADAYEQLGQAQEALRYFDHYLYLDYSNVHAHYRIACIHAELGDHALAAEELNLVLEIEELHFEARCLRAYSFLRLGDLAQCRADLEYVLSDEKAATSPHLAFYEGCYYERIGQNKDALTAFERARELGFKHHSLEHRINDLEQNISSR